MFKSPSRHYRNLHGETYIFCLVLFSPFFKLTNGFASYWIRPDSVLNKKYSLEHRNLPSLQFVRCRGRNLQKQTGANISLHIVYTVCCQCVKMQDICDTRRLASPDVCPQIISDTDLETLYYCFKINIIGANLQ